MNHQLVFRKADVEDIEILTKTRIEVLRAANNLSDDEDMTIVEKMSYEYYKNCFKEDTHIAYLVYDKDKLVGCGGVSFFKVMPTFHNSSGEKAYIMNMYVRKEYRRRGIAIKTLDLLVREARERGITKISLESTLIGRPLYKKYGFVDMKDEMELLLS